MTAPHLYTPSVFPSHASPASLHNLTLTPHPTTSNHDLCYTLPIYLNSSTSPPPLKSFYTQPHIRTSYIMHPRSALYPGALDEPVTVGGLGGKSLLVYASYENKVALINRLLEAGGDACAKDANGEFPLLAAVLRRKWQLVREAESERERKRARYRQTYRETLT